MSSRHRSSAPWVAVVLIAAILVPTTLAASRGHQTYSTRNAFNDHRAPRPVSDLQVAGADTSSVTLDWSRTWDNVGVEGYGVYLDGSRTSQTRYTRYTLEDLACGKGYTVGVDAFDDAGNRSRQTSTFVSTSACRDVTPPSAPSAVRQVAATDTTVILSWAPSQDDYGVVGYGLYVGGFWVGRWSQPSATITNLSCGKNYEIAIEAVDAAGNRSGQTSVFFSTASCSDHTAPSSPADLHVTAATENAVTLGWTAATDPSGIADYGLYLDGKKVDTTTTTSGQFAGLTCGTTHTFGVDASDKAQNRSQVASLTAAAQACSGPPKPPSTPPPPSSPTAPPNLHTTSVTQSAVALAWDSSTASSGMSGYQIFRDGNKIGEGPGVHGGYTNTWTDSGRTCGKSYEYAVAGVDSSGAVGPESTLDVTTAACNNPTPPPPPPPTNPPPTTDTKAPSAPSGVAATTRTASSIALTWQPSTDDVGVAGYGLYNSGSRVSTTTATTWIFTGLDCGQSYTLAVDAYDAKGNRSSQTVVMVSTTACADTQAPSTPTGLSVSNVSQTGATLNWTAAKDNVGVTGYDVFRNGTKMTTVTTLSSAQTGLTCNTPYTLAVDARDGSGNTSPQAQMQVTTSACSTPPPPPPPPPPSQSGVVQFSGTVSASQFLSSVNSAPSGALTVRPASGQSSFTVSGDVSNFTRANVTIENMVSTGDFRINGSADNLTIDHASMLTFYTSDGLDGFTLENSTLDGQCKIAQNWMHGTSNFKILNNTIKNFHTCSNESNHSEGIFVAAYNHDGLIQGNTFMDNGTTGHLFFSWFDGSASDHSTYPHDICVTGNTFIRSLNGYYHIQFRNEFNGSENIDIDPSNVKGASISGYNTSLSTGFVRSC
jgi:chitodextrinase